MAAVPVRICVLLCGLAMCAVSLAQPGSGTRWEISMEMAGMPEGMGFALPKQLACLPKDESEPPPADKGCTLLEQRSNGNKHFVKMQCPDGLMELEQTRTATSMQMDMKMTDRSGEVNEMTMKGKALGDCDYTAETAQQQKKIEGMQRQADEAQAKSAAQIETLCRDAVTKMQGMMFTTDGLCVAKKTEYCQRVETLDGYRLLAMGGGNQSMIGQPGFEIDKQLAICGKTNAALLKQHCASAVAATDYAFVSEFCPAEVPRLCAAAVHASLNYVARHCPAEKESLVAQHCAGRKYSSQIDAKYRNFCASSLGANPAADGAVPMDSATTGEDPAAAADSAAPSPVKEGVKNLKKVFGF